MRKGRKIVQRKCIQWFLALPKKDKNHVMKEAAFKICSYLKQGNSINLSKAMTRNELGLGYKLIDHIARSSMPVLSLQHILKQENISKRA